MLDQLGGVEFGGGACRRWLARRLWEAYLRRCCCWWPAGGGAFWDSLPSVAGWAFQQSVTHGAASVGSQLGPWAGQVLRGREPAVGGRVDVAAKGHSQRCCCRWLARAASGLLGSACCRWPAGRRSLPSPRVGAWASAAAVEGLLGGTGLVLEASYWLPEEERDVRAES